MEAVALILWQTADRPAAVAAAVVGRLIVRSDPVRNHLLGKLAHHDLVKLNVLLPTAVTLMLAAAERQILLLRRAAINHLVFRDHQVLVELIAVCVFRGLGRLNLLLLVQHLRRIRLLLQNYALGRNWSLCATFACLCRMRFLLVALLRVLELDEVASGATPRFARLIRVVRRLRYLGLRDLIGVEGHLVWNAYHAGWLLCMILGLVRLS